MKHNLKIAVIALLTLLSYGCASPDSWIGNRTIYETDYKSVNESIEFKYAFRQIMPTNERVNFEKSLVNSNYKSSTWTDNMQREGFNALAISATGAGAFSESGQAIGLGLSVLDSYISGLSEADRFSYMIFSDEWLGGKYTNKDEAHKVAITKTVNEIEKTANEFGYSMRCIADCGKSMSSYELINTSNKKKEEYQPTTLYAQLFALPFSETSELDKKVFSTDSRYKSNQWLIRIIDVNGNAIDGNKHKSAPINEIFNTSVLNQKTFKDIWGYDVFQTKLGRHMAKSLSNRLPNWVIADTDSMIEYGMINGDMYRFADTSTAKNFHGNLTSN